MNLSSVLVVCTGNICRSPYAGRVLQAALPDCAVDTAGTAAPPDKPADEVVVEMARAEGIDLSAHRSKLVTDELLRQHELILVMERAHIESIQQCTPEVAGRTMLMGHWSDRRELADPHRQSIEMYQAVFAQLKEDLALWIEKLD